MQLIWTNKGEILDKIYKLSVLYLASGRNFVMVPVLYKTDVRRYYQKRKSGSQGTIIYFELVQNLT